MTVPPRSRRGSAAVWLVLLVVLVGLGLAAWFVLKGGEASTTNSPTKPKVESAKPAEKETADASRKSSEFTSEPKKAEKGINFSVVCLGPDGASAPLANVEVTAAPAVPTGVDREHETKAVTDASGIAQFKDLPYSTYDVTAAPTGYVPLRLRGAKDNKRIELVFRKGVPLNGVIKSSETGAPVADAFVQVTSDFGISAIIKRIQMARQQGVEPADIEGYDKITEPQAFFRAEATTGPDGKFTLPCSPLAAQTIVSIDHDAFDAFEDRFEAKDVPSIEKEYSLLPRTEIFGKVVADETGEPIPGVKVQAGDRGIPINVIGLFGANSAAIIESVTDASGNYRLKRIQRGKQSLYIRYPGYDDYSASFEVHSSDPYEHQIRLKRAASLSGQVLDNANNPIEGVSIYWILPETIPLRSVALPPEPHARTGADGTFELRSVPVGKAINVLARHPEFVGAEQANIVLQPGEKLTGVQILMNRGGRITGTVIDSSKQPVVGASIVAKPVQPSGLPLSPVTTAPDGAFSIDNTQPGTFELTCDAPGYVKSINSHVKDVTTGVQFVLLKEAIYSGRFLDDASNPIPKFRVRVRPSDSIGNREIRSESIRDKLGKFSVKGLAPGLWDFEFSAEGVTPLVVERVSVREGEKIENQDLHCRAGVSIGGLVKSVSGKPIQGALVRMDFRESFSPEDKTYTTLQTSTNSNGEFEIKNLLAGRYKIWVTHPAFAPSGEREVTLAEGPKTMLDFNLPKPGSLRLVVRDEEGNTVPGAQAWLFHGDSPIDSSEKIARGGMQGVKLPNEDPSRLGVGSLSDVTGRGGPKFPVGETGELTFSRKEPGEWTLWVTAEGYYKYAQRIQLESGKETVHEAELKKLQPGMPADQATKSQNIDRNKPKSPVGPSGKDGGRVANIHLTPEEMRVMTKQKNGEELTAEETKILREARRNARDAKKANEEEGIAKKHGKGGQNAGKEGEHKGKGGKKKNKGQGGEKPEEGGSDGGDAGDGKPDGGN
jgi:hypothetical protein